MQITSEINDNEVSDANEQELRRKKLKIILDKYYFSIAALAEKINFSRANLSTLLSGTRPFTQYTANKIEASLALPYGYLSNNLENNIELTDFIDIRYYEDMKYLVGSSFEKKIKIPIEVAKRFNLNAGDDIVMTSMNDDLMYPTIKLRDMVFIDTSQNTIEDNKVYLIKVNGFYRIRRLLIDKTIVSIHIDNEEKKKTYVVKLFSLDDVDVIGKIVGLISDLN